jgi:hypothetical protein
MRRSNTNRLADILMPAMRALRPPEAIRRERRVDRAITDDGRIRAARLTGTVPTENMGAILADSVQVMDTIPTSAASTLYEQLLDTAEAIVDGSVTVADTPSLNLSVVPSGVGVEVSGVVINNGHTHLAGTLPLPYKSKTVFALSPGSIAVNTASNFVTPIAGATNDEIGIGPPQGIPGGLVWCGYINSGVVVLRIANITGGTISWAGTLTFVITVR